MGNARFILSYGFGMRKDKFEGSLVTYRFSVFNDLIRYYLACGIEFNNLNNYIIKSLCDCSTRDGFDFQGRDIEII